MLVLVAMLAAFAPQLENGGFEERELAGWKTERDAKEIRDPVFRLDSGDARQGSQSLLIETADPARAAASQTVFLRPGSLWRVSGWLKNGQNASGGRINIATPAGSVGRTDPNQAGLRWAQVQTTFRVPSPGQVSIQLDNLTAGGSPGSGKVWFDDIRLEPVAESIGAEVRIHSRKLSAAPIDSKQQGQFVEHLCRLVPSMIAQQVDDDSFEGEPPFKYAYKKEIDRPYRPWYPEGSVHVAQYYLDTQDAFNGKRSQKIILPLPNVRAGIAQDGFYVKANASYRLRLHVKGEGNVPVWATLSADGARLAEPVLLGRTKKQWTPAEARFRAGRDAGNATLVLDFEGPGTLWLDRVYLIGDDAVRGIWRPDVVSAAKGLKPGVIRFGGTSIEEFEWDQAIGNWDKRVPFTTVWGGLEPNFVGIEEFVQFCQEVGAEPMICVRWTGKQPADAAAQLEYLNGGSDTRWGKLREQNGHPEPYRVKYWQIGNEVGGPEYDASVAAFAAAMKKVDPKIRILSAFPSMETLQKAGDSLDYLSPHHYECLDLESKRAEFDLLQTQIDRFRGRKPVRVAVTEWNTTAGEFGLARGMLQTLGNALGCARYHNLMQRYSELVEIGIRSNLVDSFGSGVILTGPGWMYLSPTYYAEQLYGRAAGSYPLRVERKSELSWYMQEPDISATLSDDGAMLRVYAVNSTENALPVHFILDGFGPGIRKGSTFVVQDRDKRLDSEVMNSRDDSGRVNMTVQPAELRGSDFSFSFEAYSLTLLELQMSSQTRFSKTGK